MSRNSPSVRTIRQEFKVRGHPIGLEKAEEVQAALPKAALVTGMSERDALEVLAASAGGGALERLSVIMGDDEKGDE